MRRSLFDRQQRALDAARYRRDGGASRASQKRAARLLKASVRAEKTFERKMLAVARGVNRGFEGSVATQLPANDVRQDAKVAPAFPPDMQRRLFAYLRSHVAPAFDTMAKTVDADNKDALRLLGIAPPQGVPGMGGMLSDAKERVIARMQAAADAYADSVNELLADPEVGRDELAELIAERGRAHESRAAFVARDETLKVNSSITKLRQVAAGVAKYIWSTSQDDRVRPMHADLEGETFAWGDPPVTNEDGDTNDPGQDYQCRCVPLPVLEDLEEGDEPELPDGGEEAEPDEGGVAITLTG